MTEITLPLPIVGLACFVLAVILIAKLPVSRYTGKPAPLEALMKSMGLARLNAGVFFLILLLWITLFTLLCLGVASSIWGITTTPPPAKDDIWPWRFALANLVATTGVLGAVVALPFTLIRLNLTREQTRTATESLFNDKINAATTDLYSQREVTRWTGDEASNGWEDDVIRRNAAIDRLEGLVEERPDTAQRVARMLGVYVRELSLQYAPQKPPDTTDVKTLQKWARNLKPARSDMEKAVQTLGRLAKIPGVDPDHAIADLSGANLQGFTLPHAALEKANLRGAELQGANLIDAQLQGANLIEAQWQGANLIDAQLQGANLIEAQLQGANLIEAQLQGAYLSGARLQGADLIRAQLQGADLSGAQLQGADLIRAQLQGADLSGAQLQGADLGRAQLQGADLGRARLQGADLGRAELQGADLSGARLQGADHSGAQLQGANLIEAQLQGAYLSGAEFDPSTSLSAAMPAWAALREVDFTNIPQITEHLNVMFGDRSVILPGGPDNQDYPEHWPDQELEWGDFYKQWRDWQRKTGFDPDNPQ